MTTRRDLLRYTALGAAALGVHGEALASPAFAAQAEGAIALPPPISNAERQDRIKRAQALMQQQGMAGIVVEAGTSMLYFSGLAWGRGSRLTALVIPATGAPVIVSPAFEEGKLRELMVVDMEVRTWQEHESPFARIAGVLDDRGAKGAIGLERTTRFFVTEGLRSDAPDRALVSANAVVSALRQIKSPREIALMQAASDITMAAYRDTYAQIETGMTGGDVSALMEAATRARGGRPTFTLALVGEASAYPHGSKKVYRLNEGEIILMDCGCDVHGYKSDISRTWVHGEPSAEHRRVWNTARRGQDIVMETARIGAPIGAIDDAVRRYYEREGWGPDYTLPGLSHRTGHGIGMDVHEDQFVVRGNETPIAPGMCFSNEPGIYLPGRFGVRTEDCVYMTEDGPRLFTKRAPSIDHPMG
ncbi:MAG: Xaa-Pro peptidase family protein [Erythrobacter sp.]|uniref:M24 family metallopeptidase n=1 Tax=Erythrobacter sp. TaxID=1042 RepID=UPI002614D29C|nr:Xaa-Pro peptidase family protein [Erythrobacter sp.]MDJ0977309.1 Xaa-Pro peptidase family protein [Erythrobacter sp.]